MSTHEAKGVLTHPPSGTSLVCCIPVPPHQFNYCVQLGDRRFQLIDGLGRKLLREGGEVVSVFERVVPQPFQGVDLVVAFLELCDVEFVPAVARGGVLRVAGGRPAVRVVTKTLLKLGEVLLVKWPVLLCDTWNICPAVIDTCVRWEGPL
ncbi:hypothetical protein [Methanogenium cariaci]|uniref:hypothetical protein n=1 Tax=Methanogenium cariaci TaxID=2197 RepID=UPI001FE09EF5|nr:hypothetical protein [Methanogenium cariaci]